MYKVIKGSLLINKFCLSSKNNSNDKCYDFGNKRGGPYHSASENNRNTEYRYGFYYDPSAYGNDI